MQRPSILFILSRNYAESICAILALPTLLVLSAASHAVTLRGATTSLRLNRHYATLVSNQQLPLIINVPERGAVAHILIDSGSPFNVLAAIHRKSVATRFGNHELGKLDAADEGNATFSPGNILSNISEVLGVRIDGIIGAESLMKHCFLYTKKSHSVVFRGKCKSGDPAESIKIFYSGAGRIIIALSLGPLPIPALLDTGLSGEVFLRRNDQKRWAVSGSVAKPVGINIFGQHRNVVTQCVRDITMGHGHRGAVLSISEEGDVTLGALAVGGIVGVSWLTSGDFEIDGPRKLLRANFSVIKDRKITSNDCGG